MANENKIVTLGTLGTVFSAFENKILEEIPRDNKQLIEPQDNDLPVIYLSGNVPTRKENTTGKIEYISKTHTFTAYIKYKLQGSSTLTLPKKNYTIQFFSNENRTTPYYENFKEWGETDKFVLKADYYDILHARNVVGAKLWSKIVQSRPDYSSLPSGFKNSPNNCAIDGFPVLVYLNEEYQGVYNLTLPKDTFMFGMDKNNQNHVVLNAETNDNGLEENKFNPCNFNAPWNGQDGYDWSYEIGSNALDSWMRLYTYIYADPDVTQLQKYLDIQSAIDYYIFQNVIFGLDGMAKNMILLTYDKTKWYLSAYDMDNTFGLLGNQIFTSQNLDEINNPPYTNIFSELWLFITNNFSEDIKNRYLQLRSSALSKKSIIQEFDKYIGIYGEDVYIKDTIPYPNIPNIDHNNLIELKKFILKRLNIVDANIIGRVLNE